MSTCNDLIIYKTHNVQAVRLIIHFVSGFLNVKLLVPFAALVGAGRNVLGFGNGSGFVCLSDSLLVSCSTLTHSYIFVSVSVSYQSEC